MYSYSAKKATKIMLIMHLLYLVFVLSMLCCNKIKLSSFSVLVIIANQVLKWKELLALTPLQATNNRNSVIPNAL